MHLYFIDPNDYGDEYYVMAESKQDALDYLKAHLKTKAEDQDNLFADQYKEDYKKWETANIGNMPEQYSIEEYTIGQVAEGYNG